MSIRLPVAAAAAVTALLVAGCGSGGSGPATGAPATASASAGAAAPAAAPDVSRLAREMASAWQQATSVHVTGTGLVSGGVTGSVNLSMTRSGDLYGRATEQGSTVITLLVTRGQTYIKLDAAFLKHENAPAGVCALMCGKWLTLPAGSAQSATQGFTWPKVSRQFLKAAVSLTYAGPATVSGQAAWKLTAPHGAVFYVAARGPAYILRAVAASGPTTGTVDFSEWNTATVPAPPPASQVVNVSQLLGG